MSCENEWLQISNNHIHNEEHAVYRDTLLPRSLDWRQQKSARGKKTDDCTAMVHWVLQRNLLHNVFGSFHSLRFDFDQQGMAGIGLILPLSI